MSQSLYFSNYWCGKML